MDSRTDLLDPWEGNMYLMYSVAYNNPHQMKRNVYKMYLLGHIQSWQVSDRLLVVNPTP